MRPEKPIWSFLKFEVWSIFEYFLKIFSVCVIKLKFLQKFWKKCFDFFLKPFFASFFRFSNKFSSKTVFRMAFITMTVIKPQVFFDEIFLLRHAEKNDTNLKKKVFFCFFLAKTVVGGTFCATCTVTGYPCSKLFSKFSFLIGIFQMKLRLLILSY